MAFRFRQSLCIPRMQQTIKHRTEIPDAQESIQIQDIQRILQ